jgi:hypothetical protein
MWMTTKSRKKTIGKPAVTDFEGAIVAMDHIANWVRFADTKATILSAGVAAILVMGVGQARIVFGAIDATPLGITVGLLAVAASATLVWTLLWIVHAIRPRSGARHPTLNRFAWPAISHRSLAELHDHVQTSTQKDDAWRQVHELSRTAETKFAACRLAVIGFAVLVLTTATCILLAIAATEGPFASDDTVPVKQSTSIDRSTEG